MTSHQTGHPDVLPYSTVELDILLMCRLLNMFYGERLTYKKKDY